MRIVTRVIPVIALAAALTLGLVVSGCPGQSTPNGGVTGPPEIGKLAPDFELVTLDGKTVVLSQLFGRAVMVNFWATWCMPCRYEMPYIQQVYEDWPEEELVVLTINVGESSSRVSQFMRSEGFSFPVLLDSDGSVAQRYNVQGIPTTFFIDKYGFIQNITVGSFQSRAEIEAILSQLD